MVDKNITGDIGVQKYLCTISWRNGQLIMNQRKSADRNDLTPNRYSFLLASLERCTLSTLRMYIDRKGWLILEINNILNATQETEDDLTIIISRNISFSTEITLEQKERLYLIAEKCPVSRVLKGKITVNSN